MVIEECNDCGKKIGDGHFYCKECKQKHIKRMERSKKANQKRQNESAIRKFEAWEKSGSRTY